MKRNFWLIVISGLILIITFLHYNTPTSIWQFHLIYMELYFIPILLAAFQFGVKGGVGAALTVTAFYLPHVMLHWGGLVETNLLRFLQIILFNVIGYLTGLKAQGEREKTEKYRQLAEKLEELNIQQKRQSEMLLEMERKLRATDRLAIIGEMTASLAHEVRNPLASIRGAIEILKEKAPEDLKSSEFFEILEQETKRINAVVENYLSFARKPTYSQSLVSVAETIELLLKMLESRARKQSVKMEFIKKEPLPHIETDANLFKQVLMNLVLNALQAMPKGGQLTVLAKKVEGNLIIEVNDQGKGIPPDQIDKIFQPFFTTREDGTGLGLSIVKRIVDENRWQISVKSKVGQGSSFEIRIPLT